MLLEQLSQRILLTAVVLLVLLCWQTDMQHQQERCTNTIATDDSGGKLK